MSLPATRVEMPFGSGSNTGNAAATPARGFPAHASRNSAAASTFFAFTSQRATMFSLETFLRSDAPWPPQPMDAMFSFALGDFSWP